MSRMPSFASAPKFSVMKLISLCTCVSQKPKLRAERSQSAGSRAEQSDGAERRLKKHSGGWGCALIDDDGHDVRLGSRVNGLDSPRRQERGGTGFVWPM